VTILLNGRPVQGYIGTFEAGGHVFVPVRPLITRIVDRLWYTDGRVAIERDGRTIYIILPAREPDALDRAYVPLRAVMQALGAGVGYDQRMRYVEIHLAARAVVASPAPFDESAPQVSPRAVFTPVPALTPRPVWSGPALPRRTPLPFASPSARGNRP
jgi:hypothetical protein